MQDDSSNAMAPAVDAEDVLELNDEHAAADESQPAAQSPHVQLEQRLRRMRRIAGWLFLLTCGSTWLAGANMFGVDGGVTYAVAVMSILVAHEFGHYLQTLKNRVPASPPMFIPMPFVPFGTLGAVIIQGSGYADRKSLFDIAISGPLAGLVVALPVCWWGIQQSSLVTVEPPGPGEQSLQFGDPLILTWMVEMKHGPLAENQDVTLNPLLFAGWVGVFITALNLMPIGQLDGGHILYTLIGKHAHVVANGLILGAFVWMVYTLDPAYALMVGLLILMGTKHPPTADDTVAIGRTRAVLGALTLAFVVIGFTPRPLTIHEPDPAPIELMDEPIPV